MKILPWLLFFIFASGILSVIIIENKISNTKKKKTTGRGGDFQE
jgi:uncharacterized membrane protein YraQ (UPF0718 family)